MASNNPTNLARVKEEIESIINGRELGQLTEEGGKAHKENLTHEEAAEALLKLFQATEAEVIERVEEVLDKQVKAAVDSWSHCWLVGSDKMISLGQATGELGKLKTAIRAMLNLSPTETQDVRENRTTETQTKCFHCEGSGLSMGSQDDNTTAIECPVCDGKGFTTSPQTEREKV